MKGRFLQSAHRSAPECNIYADKSSLILDWLLRIGIHKKTFSIREVAQDRKLSVGLVQRVFAVLVSQGILTTQGIRTSKQFSLKKPETLLSNWLHHYNLLKKCKIYTYRSGFQSKEELLLTLNKSKLNQKTALALHSAAEQHKCKNTNLHALELYLSEPGIRHSLETLLELEPQEKGYEVLLIEPYYKSLLKLDMNTKATSPLLTFLDLYHFPLRGQEQAEFMLERIPELKRIYRHGS